MKKIFSTMIIIVLLSSSLYAQTILKKNHIYAAEIKSPIAISDSVDEPYKMAEGSYTSYFNFFSFIPIPAFIFDGWLITIGDASIDTIAKKKGITKIHYVDEEVNKFWFFIYFMEEKKVRVYGN